MASQPHPSLPLPPRWPRHVRSAAVHALARMALISVGGRRGQHLKLVVTHLAGRWHLPIVELKKAG